MVLVPRDEDMIRRSAQRTLEEGKEVPESAVLDMKANFSLPYEGENLFDSITFLELQRAEAQAVVERYNRFVNGSFVWAFLYVEVLTFLKMHLIYAKQGFCF